MIFLKQSLDSLYKKLAKRTFFSQRLLHKKLSEYSNSIDKKKCFILGNGPSLTWELVHRLEGEITFAFNKIYLMPESTGIAWHPTFYMVEDNLVLSQNVPDITSFCKNNPNMVSFFRFYRNSPYASISNVFQYNYIDNHVNLFSLKPWHYVVSGQSVVYSAIQVAVALGFQKIILLGVDFNFGRYDNLITEDGVILGSDEQTHFSKKYRKENEKWNPPNLDMQRKFFKEAKIITSQLGIAIIDCTPNGKLGIFGKANIDDVLMNG